MPPTKSVVISCAGIGSRLGLGQTKALIKINGKTLIRWQLELLTGIDDIRIVVGYEAQKVINEVIKYRDDVIFVYNHNYFETKTGTSFYLGAKDANEYVIEWDGDLLVHPEDAKKLLEINTPFIAYSDKMSDEAVYVKIDNHGSVLSFSRESGDFEWTGPACMEKSHIRYTSLNVYNQLEDYLPMRGIKIRACDIDTYDDYLRAVDFINRW